MVELYQDYIEKLLKESGMKKVCKTMKELELFSNPHVSAVIIDKDAFEVKDKRKVYDNNGNTVKRVRKYERNTTLNVVIGEYETVKCDDYFAKFLSLIDKGIYDNDGNFISIELGEADWVSSKDSILKSTIAVQIPVIFHGGIYKEHEYKKVNWNGDGVYVRNKEFG